MSDELLPPSLLADAAAWQARLPGDAGDRREFEQWLARDLRHRLAWAEVGAAVYALEQCAVPPDLAQALPRASSGRWRSARRGWFGGGLAALLLLGLAWQGSRPWDRWRADLYSAEGEIRQMTLADGSRAWLAGDSALALDYTDAAREVRLLRGEAFFEVRPDAARPFSVRAGATRATALGTRYAVALRAAGVVVEVEEGRVAVAQRGGERELRAGEQLRLAPDDSTATARPQPLPDGALAWRDGLLVFAEAPAVETVARLDAYVPGRLLLLGDARQARISAAIRSGDAQAGLLAIAAQQGWQVEGIEGVLLVLR